MRHRCILSLFLSTALTIFSSACAAQTTTSQSTTPVPAQAARLPTFTYVLPSDEWVRDAPARQHDRSAQLVLTHRVTKASVLVRGELRKDKDPSQLAMSEMITRATTGARVGEFARDPKGLWGSFAFVYGESMFGRCLVFLDPTHPEWIIVVTSSWDMARDRDDLMDLEMDGIATYLRIVP